MEISQQNISIQVNFFLSSCQNFRLLFLHFLHTLLISKVCNFSNHFSYSDLDLCLPPLSQWWHNNNFVFQPRNPGPTAAPDGSEGWNKSGVGGMGAPRWEAINLFAPPGRLVGVMNYRQPDEHLMMYNGIDDVATTLPTVSFLYSLSLVILINLTVERTGVSRRIFHLLSRGKTILCALAIK